ncbi:dolichyl-phosphate-mannose-protein mannosyltransferase [Yimella lutea]|uniref:Polyprenol-phosphate-mannose--protein mannosyltransferase n=1 Tax=Yimella lutea TaxID=587872 RepID=A0A542EDZ2_9MICO|nr:phospholipid carrier-dependent glycosyltransferase [Yimella lutea]TQJ13562.1 dolichyl-phosphate-mannose-protein mannosyltransferase [Yimella lutea]
MSSLTAEREALRRRLLGRPRTAQEKLWAWLGPAIITVIGGVLRFWELGRPHQLVFDETYYVKQGWSMMQYGYEMKPTQAVQDGKAADSLFTMGNWQQGVYGTEADFIVHPPLGKWLIGAGEWIFGIDNSIGWRFAVALMGTLAIYLTGRAAWHLFRSPLLAIIASLLMAFEGQEFVMSRTGILDIIVMFWALAAFVALLADRERTRGILADKVARMKIEGTWTEDKAAWSGPFLGLRPWRWVAGLCIGLDLATKWSGGFFLVFFGLMTVWWDLGARRAVGSRHWISGTIFKDALPAMVFMIPVALATYLATWWGWFASKDAWGRNWAANNPADKDSGLSADSSLFGWMPDSMRSLWHYHQEMYTSAASIVSPHNWESNPWSWMIQSRPTLFFAEWPNRGAEGCEVAKCAKVINPIGTPLIWWLGTIALVVLIFHWVLKRDWRAPAILAGIAAAWLPWFSYQERTIFTFYSVAFAPYVVLAVVFVLGLLLGAPDASAQRRKRGMIAVGAIVVACVAMFVFFWPIYTAQVIPHSHWQARMWLPSWS